MGLAFIPNPDNYPQIDHIDRKPNNNILSNLRWATQSKNQGNRSLSSNNKTGYKGVDWDEINKKWRARISQKSLGRFMDKIEAAEAYNKAAIEKFGDFACLNKIE
jgi:hypothetical protein